MIETVLAALPLLAASPQEPPPQATALPVPAAVATRVAAPAPALARIFAAIGDPPAARALGGVVSRLQLQVLDHRGGVLSDLVVVHEADLAGARRDRLSFSGPGLPERAYARDGARVYAEMYGMVWAPLQAHAAEELEVFGMLLRFPWVFADSAAYAVEAAEEVVADGVTKVLVRIRKRSGPAAAAGEGGDRFDILCGTPSGRPEELRWTKAATGRTVRILLSDYLTVRGVELPRRRVFLDADGAPRLVMRIREIATGASLPTERFAPRR